ncbi:relA-associated inhibitor [Oryzias melastigma]|uniref:relA-associated inhibitor n=1 Tax=Oryzias melastigma TaxID=30732 RepID=UPI000CF7D5A4|nr:relA-associated inhibitor [Oryzias melastigma]
MSSQGSFGANFLFQSINDDLNASLATADELSKEFSSLLKEASSSSSSSSSNNIKNTTAPQSSSTISKEPLQPSGTSSFSNTSRSSGSGTNGSSISSSISGSMSSSSLPYFHSTDSSSIPSSMSSSSLPYFHGTDSSKSSSSSRNVPPSQALSQSPHSSPKSQKRGSPPIHRFGSDSYLYNPQSANPPPPAAQPPSSPSFYDRNPPTFVGYSERAPPPNVRTGSMDRIPYPSQNPSSLLNPYDGGTGHIGRRSPRTDKPSPLSFSPPAISTLPRNFTPFRQSDDLAQRKKNPGKWSETDLDMSFDRKPHHTYDKTEWLRPAVPKGNWRESNLDGPPPSLIPKQPQQMSYGSLNRPTRRSVPPDVPSSAQPPFMAQPISSRISIPPNTTLSRQNKPIPLSVILRLQNPRWGAMRVRHPRAGGGEGERGGHQSAPPPQREYVRQPPVQVEQQAPPAAYSDVLNSGDVDAELERLEYPGNPETPSIPGDGGEVGLPVPPVPRPLSPTRLQPVVAPETQEDEIPDREELLRIRAEIPRALKRRGAVELSEPPPQIPSNQPNQYKNLIDKLFRKRGRRHKGEQSSDGSSSSDDEGRASVPTPTPAPVTSTLGPQEAKNYRTILRRPGRKSSGKRARLSPLVLLLDGALVGELETVQKAVQEMTDPSQPNDEGITGLHNSICGGHYNVVEFLVRIGANVSAPDSHGWTPLHCAASCNDLHLCEFLVRSGAAVMAVTERDNATAAQKCDPYTVGYEECESFLRGVEEAMGVENSGVLYALWSYPAQAADELSFKEGDMVTILHKPEGSDWWWASLCGREGFVPNNYFGLFPKVRPKSLC